MYGVETFRTFVTGWYDGSLQDVIFYREQAAAIHRMICSVLAGYAWDTENVYTGTQSSRRLRALAAMCRDGSAHRADRHECVVTAPRHHRRGTRQLSRHGQRDGVRPRVLQGTRPFSQQ